MSAFKNLSQYRAKCLHAIAWVTQNKSKYSIHMVTTHTLIIVEYVWVCLSCILMVLNDRIDYWTNRIAYRIRQASFMILRKKSLNYVCYLSMANARSFLLQIVYSAANIRIVIELKIMAM